MNERRLTEDGFETTFQVNHLAPFVLTRLLMDRLKASAPARVVVVSSIAHESARLDFANLQGERRFDGYQAYAVSKLENILFTYALAERFEGTGVTANCLHPGVITTKLLYQGFQMTGDPVESGARTPVYLASSPDAERVSGKYFVDCAPARSAPVTYDGNVREKLWKISAELAGVPAY